MKASRYFLLASVFAGLLVAAEPPKVTIYDFNLPDLDGKMVALSQFKGKALLIVNVASNSSYTPQYSGLEALYEREKAAGLVVLAFPSNDFGGEEPNPEPKISSLCRDTYHVSFPVFSKIAVRGDEITPLFSYLTKEANPKVKGDVHWTFTKFVIDREGKLTARFGSDVEPDDPDLQVAIENALKGKSKPSRQTPPSPPGGSRTRRTRDGE
jgi:glutathione peroxidase